MTENNSGSKTHWEGAYSEYSPGEVSWFEAHPRDSLELIRLTGASKEDDIIDVGAGASTLVDHLLIEGFKKIAVLDISGNALEFARKRLGERARDIHWIEADIREFEPEKRYRVWHDRAVFHFLTDPHDRRKYVQTLKGALLPGGQVIIATFSLEGPKQCSGLDVARYSPEMLATELGEDFELVQAESRSHRTPWGSEQAFVYCRFRRAVDSP